VNERYTEFILEDLNSKLYHYWALGHIHERQQLSDMPVINYSGNIQGRHFNEQGEKGCLLIEGDHLKLKTKFYPTQYIRFEEATIETDKTSKQGLYEVIQSFKQQVREEGKAFYRLTLVINSETLISPQDLLQVEEMITDYEENENQFVYIDELKIQYAQNDESPLVNEFSAELLVDQTVFDKAMSDLYLNPRASKFLDDYGTFDHTALVNRAEEILKAEMRGEQNDN
ncbi:DNA repair exonuclease, partial [Staphylococcus aureus]|nr:DNA repair exonuclease [Staphylococcus aureus]